MSEEILIPLTKGHYTIVDEDDYEQLMLFNWHVSASPTEGKYYACCNVGKTRDRKRKRIIMHRFIMKFPKGLVVDHINGNCLDNRKVNLRVVTQSVNAKNQRKRAGSSIYRGVNLHKPGIWRAKVTVDYKTIHLGLFECEQEDGKAAALGREKYYGQ
jgi:hypothetical protein